MTGVQFIVATVSRARQRARWPLKQASLISAERGGGARAAWRVAVSTLNRADLVFVDETNTHRSMALRRARASRGERPWVAFLAYMIPTSRCWRPSPRRASV